MNDNNIFNLEQFVTDSLKRMKQNFEKGMGFFNNERCFEIWFCHAAQSLIEKKSIYKNIRIAPEFSSKIINKELGNTINWLDIAVFDLSTDKRYAIELKYKTEGEELILFSHDLPLYVGKNKNIPVGLKLIEKDKDRIERLKMFSGGCVLLATNLINKKQYSGRTMRKNGFKTIYPGNSTGLRFYYWEQKNDS